MKRTRWCALGGCLCLSLVLCVRSAWADGFRNPPDTAAALGQAGNDRVWVDDASTIFVNPANLVDVPTRQVQVSGTVGYNQSDYSGSLGATKTEDPWSGLPAFALAWPLKDEGLAAGFGVHVPYGRQTVWDRDGFFRDLAPYCSKMMVLDATPALAWRVCDQVSVGLGLDLYYGRMQFRQLAPWSLPPPLLLSGEGEIDAKGEGYAIGANAGVTWQVTERQRLALTCRSPFDLRFDGDTTVQGVPGAVAESDFSSTFFFPTIVGLGYGLQITDSLRLEADVEWLQYSRTRRLAIDAGANNPLLAGAGLNRIPENWDDSWTFGLGANWRCTDHWTMRAGYLYLQSPIPDSTFMPSMLDADQSVLATGLGYRIGRHSVDLAYAVGILDSRQVRDNQQPYYDGNYSFGAQLVALTYTLAF